MTLKEHFEQLENEKSLLNICFNSHNGDILDDYDIMKLEHIMSYDFDINNYRSFLEQLRAIIMLKLCELFTISTEVYCIDEIWKDTHILFEDYQKCLYEVEK